MAPVTRSTTAGAAGFPNVPAEGEDGHLERRVEDKTTKTASNNQKPLATDAHDVPPTYTIDLSLPPAERYVEVAKDFKEHLIDLIGLFDEVVGTLQVNISLRTIKRLAKLFLRRVHSSEQTEELRGISKAIGVEMYLLVSLNTLLDLFMGCTSGGVKVGDEGGVRMMHFRTLDWGMEVLRKVVVQFEFVDKPHGEVIGRSVTYVGFVGMLTGVRPGLSLSLNFRGNHNNSTSKWANLRYYSNHLAVLLGFRPSIASTLREYIIAPANSIRGNPSPLPTLAQITSSLPSTTSTACYIIACDGDSTTVFEKDRVTAAVHLSRNFITATNHDLACEGDASHPSHPSKMGDMLGMDDLIEESMDRKQCMEKNWKKAVAKYRRENPRAKEDDVSVTLKEVQKWMKSYPVANECTHYAVVMDPKKGEIVWLRRYLTIEGTY